MVDLHTCFRELDRLDAPEVWPEIVRRGPKPTKETPSPRRRVGIAILALLIAVAGLGFAIRAFRLDSGVPGVPPPTLSNGKIAFAGLGADGWQINTINPDGTSDITLTQGRGDAIHPSWSPDGSQILFDVQSPTGNMQIFVMNDDGTGLTQLTGGLGSNYLPSWSPDGSSIAFVSTRDGNDEIYAMNADGSAQRRLTSSPNEDLNPSWSRDGYRIAFQSNRRQGNDIYVMNADGSSVTRLTEDSGAFDGQPQWSPDGSKIAFASDRDGPGLYTMSATGTDVVQVTHDANVGSLDPAWSPDGSSIVYTTSVNGANQNGIFIVDVSTGSRQALRGVGGDVCCPSWQPIPVQEELPSASPAPTVLESRSYPLSSPADELAAAGGWVWAAEGRTNTVEKIDPTTGDVVASIPMIGYPRWLASGNGVLWVGLAGTEITAVVGIDTATNEIVLTAHGVTGPLVQTDEGLWGFELRSPQPNWMVVIDPRTGGVIRHVEIQSQPMDIAASGDSVWVLDIETGTVQLLAQGGGAQVLTDRSSGTLLAATALGVYLSTWRGDSANPPGGDGTSSFAGLNGEVQPFGDIYNFRPTVVANDRVWFVAGPHDGSLSGLCGMRTTDAVVDTCADIAVGLEGIHHPVAFDPATGSLWAIPAEGSTLYGIQIG